MSLVVRVSVNDDPPLSIIMAQRITGIEDVPAADDVNVYKVTRLERRPDSRILFEHTKTDCTHRYGDGATALAAKALTAVYTEGEEWP